MTHNFPILFCGKIMVDFDSVVILIVHKDSKNHSNDITVIFHELFCQLLASKVYHALHVLFSRVLRHV